MNDLICNKLKKPTKLQDSIELNKLDFKAKNELIKI